MLLKSPQTNSSLIKPLHFTVKPTIQMAGDKTPDLMMSEDEESQPPIGDIAELTARVSENATLPEASAAGVPSSARVRVYTSKKNKGVGKGSSGSAGAPPAPKRKATATVSKPPAQDESTDEENATSSDDDDDAENAVGNSKYHGRSHKGLYILPQLLI